MTFDFTIRLQHTDAAGVMFFVRQFELAHLAYEQLLERLGVPLPADLARLDVLYPIVHAEADYERVLRLGDRVRVTVSLGVLTERSFTLEYDFRLADGARSGRARTVHVAVEAERMRSVAIPDRMRAALSALETAAGPG